MTNTGEFVISKQLLKCGTSIGANIREADYSESRRDLLHKLSIALKETNETLYWLELLETCNLGDPDTFKEIKDLSIQLLRMLISATRKIKMSL